MHLHHAGRRERQARLRRSHHRSTRLSSPPSTPRPLYELIAAWDGREPLELPEESENGDIQFACGARDGIATHHMASLSEADEARQVYAIADTLRHLVDRSGDEAWTDLCALAGKEQVVRYADALGSELARLGDLTAVRVAPHARRLVRESANGEALKLGILLVGLYGEPSDLEMLLTLGRHEEFTLFTALAVARLVTDPLPVWWRMARGLQGWGKVHLVERICDMLEESEGGHEQIRSWLLREGCENDVLPEYVACRCALAGALHEALASVQSDEALIDGASLIVEALMNDEGPSEDMSDYPHGVEVVQHLLRHLEQQRNDVRRLSTIVTIRTWLCQRASNTDRAETLEALGWTPSRRDALMASCDALIAHPGWKQTVEEAYDSDDYTRRRLAWSVAVNVGADLWEKGFARLERSPLEDVLYWELLQTPDVYRQRRVMVFAERNLPLAEIASGPGLEMGLGDPWRPHQCLGYILQEMCHSGLFSPALVTAGLRNPVMRVRGLAIAALEHQPVEVWGEGMTDTLARSLREEPKDPLRERLKSLWLRV